MKKLIAFTTAAVASAAIFAAPVVSDVTMSQDGGKTVSISYKLTGEPGIVTVDIQTNAGDNVWVSIGGRHLTHFSGDANRLVQPSDETLKKITWKPHKAWPDNEVTENVKAVVSAWSTNAPPDYMVVSLVALSNVFFYANAEAVPFGVTNDMYKTEWLLMRKIPAANVQWRMGSPTTEPGRVAGEREPAHLVTLDDDYYIGVYEFTQRQHELIMTTDNTKPVRPSYFNLDADYETRPVENLAYEDLRGAKASYDWPNKGHDVNPNLVIGKVRTFSGLNGFDLPTEAQWEFACRAGCGHGYYNGTEYGNENISADYNLLARNRGNGGYINFNTAPARTCTADNGTAKVGMYEPNAWGLYDMLGNVFEICLDWYAESPQNYDAAKGPASGTNRVRRGGAWDQTASIRCATRLSVSPLAAARNANTGFRLACSVNLQ